MKRISVIIDPTYDKGIKIELEGNISKAEIVGLLEMAKETVMNPTKLDIIQIEKKPFPVMKPVNSIKKRFEKIKRK